MLSYLVVLAVAATQPAQWQADYGTALTATRKAKQPLLIVLDRAEDEKNQVDAKLLNVGGEYAELLKNYQLCRVDVTSEYGKRVVRAFGATTLPHVSIIDKTGSVVLFKNRGQMSAAAWKSMLTKHASGERQTRVAQTTYYRGGTNLSANVETPRYSTAVSSPSYCPSCQRRGY